MTPKQKRSEIKRILFKLDDHNRLMFKRMYSNNNLEKDIDLVVDDMPAKQLDWALQQCKNTYYKIFKILAGKV
jgi:hypothetical protein